MQNESRGRVVKIALGLLMLGAAIVGGDTVSNFNGDLLIFAAFLVFGLALPDIQLTRVGTLPAVFGILILLCVLVQMLPLGMLDSDGLGPMFLTSSFIETSRVLLSAFCALMVLFVALSLSYTQVRALMPFLYVALYCNLLMGAVQFSSRTRIREGLFDYPLAGGFFVNPNHFSTFLVVFIPFLMFSILYEKRKRFAVGTLCAVLLVLLAANSMAGVGLGLVVTVASALGLMERRHLSLYAVLGGLLLVAVYLVGFQNQVSMESSVSATTRYQFAMTTLEGIRAYFWMGVGYGTFADAYPMFMRPEDIQRWYVNHAHNDYLELVFEGGILALMLIVLYLALFVRQAWLSWSDPFKRSAAIAIAIILIHSTVDYPIRTFAILLMFAVLNGVLFHQGKRVKMPRSRTLPVLIDGQEVSVPMARVRTG
ncbi:hypothetical protein GTW51_22535 [Aurantimonas aggregata]|uniref:O-antigen ligase-related domain-containing protein n=1 Tax=Aurantimonas aggregata TaxID=2047720 RepID=A0A6L9MPM9_9HYPH|nr:O-antigen ligase family protein [Aurantimonas aggregata]NDV89428.1 hypothetical protein [Aurantimonas aggregata]